MGLIMISHDLNLVRSFCDRVLMLKGGRMVDQGTPAELLARYGRDDMEQVFLDIARGTGVAA